VILVDTSVWIDHLHEGEPALVELLERSMVLQHPLVTGELAVGAIAGREAVLSALSGLSGAAVASHEEAMHLIEERELYGRGLGLVDIHLLASTLLGPATILWTRDKRLLAAAKHVGARVLEPPALIR
jgi:predicted nucleic acid-binding protein